MTQKTTATVGEAASFPVNIPGGEAAGGVLAALVSAVVGIMYFRRKFSRDGTEIIKDKADGDLTKSLMEAREASRLEAKEAREETKAAWAEYNKLIAEVGQLRAENAYLKREAERLLGELTKAQNKLDEIRGDLWELRKRKSNTDNSPLN